ncbi:MAG TPA: dienelactone hydrolase family protein [Acidimicrobiales bacterium]
MNRKLVSALVAILTVCSAAVIHAQPAGAVQYGPAPTTSSIRANGTFAYTSQSVSDFYTPGFGAATIYYPTSTTQTYGGIAVVPGYTGTQSSISWYGPRLASHGFVVITIDTNSRYDDPSERATQLLAALDWLTGSWSGRARVDRNRLGVMGHSMGGGGSIEAAARRPSLQAAVPLTPWHTDKTWSTSTPVLIFGADGDSIAPVSTHAEPLYSNLQTTEKAYLELNGANHYTPNSTNSTISAYALSWFKRFVDDDLRYDQFLCPPPAPSTTIEEYRSTCPH